MGLTYSIYDDVPPSISHLTKQKQSMIIEAKLIVIYIDSSSAKKSKETKNYSSYRSLINKLNAKGFIVITICCNLCSDKIVTDPSRGVLQVVLNKIRGIYEKYSNRSISITIRDISFLSHAESCNSLLNIFDVSDRLKGTVDIYEKIKSSKRTSTIQHVLNSDITYEWFYSNINSLILLEPESNKKIRLINRIEKPVQIIFTESFNIATNHKLMESIERVCVGALKADRIKNVKTTDITIRSNRNISEKTIKHDKIDLLVTHLIDFTYLTEQNKTEQINDSNVSY
jgi:hypothetical protein